MTVPKSDARVRSTSSPAPVVAARPGLATLGAVAVISAAALAWEIVLTRLASALLAYHYAFVAVSLAVSGLGLGAALVYAVPERRGQQLAGLAALVAAGCFLLAALLTPMVATQGTLAWLVLLALLPFLAVGAAFAAAFRAGVASVTLLYGADLGGAGVGALAAVAGLDAVGPFGVILALVALSAAAALLFALDKPSLSSLAPPARRAAPSGGPASWRRRGRAVAMALLCSGVAGLCVQVARAPLGIDYAALGAAPPDKTIAQVLRDPAQHAHIIDARWDAYARTDVVATADRSRRLVFTDGGAGTYMLAWNGTLASQAAVRYDLETLPFLLGPHANVLIIGAGGGIDIVRALVAGARHVTAVELNGATVAAVRAARGYNGNILDRPGVTTVVDDARHVLARSHARYDTILLNLVYTGAAEGTSHALAESYIFTTQAFRLYLDHLTPRGRIGIISHQAIEGMRAFTTGVEALHERGAAYPDAMQRAAVLMTDNSTPESRPTLTVLQNAPLTRQQADALHGRAVTDLRLTPLYLPHYSAGRFGDLRAIEGMFAQFLQDSDYQGGDYAIGPTDDDRPFFFDLNSGLPEGLGDALLAAALLVGGVLVLVLFLREPPEPVRSRGDGALTKPRGAVWSLGVYMALLGIGFMCVEVPVIQRFILILGQPVLALTTVLATVLIAGGVGSVMGGRLFSSPHAPILAPLLVAVLILLTLFVLPPVQALLLPRGLVGAIVGSAVALAPLGVALGLPFPVGLRLAARYLPGDIALFWSLNALFSVLGSVLAAVIAVQCGFTLVLVSGMVCYALAAWAGHVLHQRDHASAIVAWTWHGAGAGANTHPRGGALLSPTPTAQRHSQPQPARSRPRAMRGKKR